MISKIIIAVPFLGWPVINQIFTKLVYKLASMFIKEVETLAIFMKIDFKVNGQRERYEEATDQLREVLKTPNTNEDVQRAKDEYKNKLRDLIMLGTT